ncbi:MAG: glycosyltransferase [Planctomycetes bacterium]|nr:glycosyltransferase [Planctomycetota bacterium]
MSGGTSNILLESLPPAPAAADSQRICMIGPSYPFRGGIAHYTTLLYRALKARYDVKFYSFKRQYPQWLYPGRTDRDPSGFAIAEPGVEPLLDSLNPATWWRTAARIAADRPDLLIVPWWVSYWTPQFWTIVRRVRRVTAARVLFICHNVVQHESRRWDRLCAKAVLRNGDYFLVHSEEDLVNLKRMLPDACVKKVFHPTYEVFNRRRMTKAQAQKQLGVSGRVLLFFGNVRPYKGLKYLLDAMPALARRLDAHLLVAGEFWRDKDQYLRQVRELGIERSVTFVDRYIPNEEVDVYFAAADVVVLPYVTATQSGIVQIAYGFDKPVIVTNVGGLPDVVEHGRTGFVVEGGNAKAVEEAVLSFYESDAKAQMERNIAAKRQEFSWERITEAVGDWV